MEILGVSMTDIGAKPVNQDSVLYLTGNAPAFGQVVLAAVFDGMGGLQHGELASGQLSYRFHQWFSADLPKLLGAGFTFEAVRQSWTALLQYCAGEILQYGQSHGGISLGSTATCVLAVSGRYLIAHVGDCRVYEITADAPAARQLTKDQTAVQREVDRGNMTQAEAEVHPKRNVLLQCVGTGAPPEPVFYEGVLRPDSLLLVCCDGFRHNITPQELFQAFYPPYMTEKSILEARMRSAVDLVKARGEKDNISLITMKVSG